MSAYYGRRFYVLHRFDRIRPTKRGPKKGLTMYEQLRRELKDAYAFTDELIDGIINYISTNPSAYERIEERMKERTVTLRKDAQIKEEDDE